MMQKLHYDYRVNLKINPQVSSVQVFREDQLELIYGRDD
jgi:hypothetical protein